MPEFAAPWEKSYPAGMSARAAIDTFPVHDIVQKAAGHWPRRTAISFRQRAITYLELDNAVGTAVMRLAEAGIKKGDRVALLLPNTPWHPVVFFAALSLGATIVHLSPLDSAPVLQHKIADSGARILVTTNTGGLCGRAAELVSGGAVHDVIVCEDACWGDDPDRTPLPDDPGILVWSQVSGSVLPAPALPAIAVDDLALLQYTGGTTGLPKAAMLSHRNLSASMSSYELWNEGWGLIDEDAIERILLILPLFHIYGLSTVMLRALNNGNEILLRSRFDAAAVLDDIETGVTAFPGVPTMWIALSTVPGFETRDLSSLKIAASGGAPLPAELATRLREKMGLDLVGGWGMSETSPAGTNLPPARPDKNGTIGIPLPGVFLRIVSLDDPSRELEQGETGEIAVRGSNVTSGYLNRPEDNAACFADGWFLTGDIGFMDEDGYFTIVDRKKDMILSGGFNVYPQMIEQAIYQHDDVEEVLVIGIADAYRGEAAKAFVKLRAGAPNLTLEALRTFLKPRLGPHELPAALEIRSGLPRTPVGKLSKIELKQEEAARAASKRAS